MPKRRWACSATAMYSIVSNETRHQMDANLFDMKYKLVSMLVLFMIQNTRIIGHQPEQVTQLNEMILQESEARRHENDSMTFWWCTKLKLLSYLNVDQLGNDPSYKQTFVQLLNVFGSDAKSMHMDSECGDET
eukprot:280720_1